MRLIPFLAVLAIACGPKATPVAAEPATPTAEDGMPSDGEPDTPIAPLAPGEPPMGSPGSPDVEGKPGSPPECPQARETADMCAQVMTWAKNPADGSCCPYNTPCEPPEKWEQFTEEDCGAAPTPMSTVSCEAKLLLSCGDGLTDGCKMTRPDGAVMTTMHVCVPDTEKDGPSCTLELARDCPDGHVDACVVNAADVHICIQDTRK